MTWQLVAVTLTVLMHIVCFAIMTERKYSVKGRFLSIPYF